jgi:hypothetical protein
MIQKRGRRWVRLRALNATFNNISVISWQSALSVKETGVPRENQEKIYK